MAAVLNLYGTANTSILDLYSKAYEEEQCVVHHARGKEGI